jgi:peptidoglycan/LPS O-acetylase OafA/YrhL
MKSQHQGRMDQTLPFSTAELRIRENRITPSGKEEIDALTGIRGVAACLVIAYHIYPSEDFPWGLHQLVARGYLAVDVFFVLSGFVMALNYGRMFRNGPTVNGTVTFLLRRVARLYPLYITFLALRVGYSFAAYGSVQVPGFWFAMNLEHPVKDLIANALMIQSWGIARAITNPTWSISTEWGAYFIFPLILAPILFRRWAMAILAGLVGAGLIFLAGYMTLHDGMGHNGRLDAFDGRTLVPMTRCLGGFVLGIVTFRVYGWAPARRFAGSGMGWLVGLLILGGICLQLSDMILFLLFPPLVLCLACDRGWLGRIFSWGPIFQSGVLSYAIYVLHNVWIGPLNWARHELPLQMPQWVAETVIAGCLVVSLFGVAVLAHHWVEVPGRRLVRAIGDALVKPRRSALNRG